MVREVQKDKRLVKQKGRKLIGFILCLRVTSRLYRILGDCPRIESMQELRARALPIKIKRHR